MTPEEQLKQTCGRMRQIRLEKGLTAEDVAFRADMERSNYSDIEAGKTNFRFTTLCRIASALKVEVSDLVK